MTAAYYSDDLVTLYHGDCLGITEWLAADVLVTDPPYGVDYQSGSRREKLAASILNDTDTHVRDGILELWGSKPALVFGSWKIARPADTKARLIWDTKGALGMGDLSIPWKPSDQEIYVLGRGPWRGRRDSNVLSFAPVQAAATNGRRHPHEKPVRLMTELVAKTLGVVADPTAGSGSTLVAAKLLGRRVVGVELDERYCEIAKWLLEALDVRDGHVCSWLGYDTGRLVPQHRQGGMGGRKGKHRLSNVVWLDSFINGLIESDPVFQAEAIRRGIKISGFEDPERVPVLHAAHGRVRLDDAGGVGRMPMPDLIEEWVNPA